MQERIKYFISVLTGALILMVDSFYNGFPIVYSDTSTYIASAFELETPFDRPITYGLFLRLSSLNGLSLWFVIFFQAFILSYLIFQLVKLVIGKESSLLTLFIILFLLIFTGVSWTVSQVMPDIFTAIGLICVILILYGKYDKKKLIMLNLLFFVSVAMHMSHILLFTLLLTTIFVLRKYALPELEYRNRNTQILIMLTLTIASIVSMGSAFSKSKHVFFMGAMVEHGIVKQYLDDNCGEKQYKLCAFKDSLPDKAYKFIWDEKSPFYKVGGWKETESEFKEIIYATLTQPKYIKLHIRESIKATFQQLLHFDAGDGNGSFMQGTLLYQRIKQYFAYDLSNYSNSKQNRSQLFALNFCNAVFLIIVIFSLLLIIVLPVFFKKVFERHLKIIIGLFVILILFNAWDCGTFANAIDRLGCKVIWLLPFITITILCKIILERNGKINLNHK